MLVIYMQCYSAIPYLFLCTTVDLYLHSVNDNDAYTHTHVITVAHVKNAMYTQNEIWKIRLYRWYSV